MIDSWARTTTPMFICMVLSSVVPCSTLVELASISKLRDVTRESTSKNRRKFNWKSKNSIILYIFEWILVHATSSPYPFLHKLTTRYNFLIDLIDYLTIRQCLSMVYLKCAFSLSYFDFVAYNFNKMENLSLLNKQKLSLIRYPKFPWNMEGLTVII